MHQRDNSLLDSFTEFCLRDLLHFREDHRRNLLGAEGLLLSKVANLDKRRTVLLYNSEWPVGHVL